MKSLKLKCCIEPDGSHTNIEAMTTRPGIVLRNEEDGCCADVALSPSQTIELRDWLNEFLGDSK